MKIRRFLFVISAMLLMVQGASAWSGSGTSSGDPYLIASPADWETLATSNITIVTTHAVGVLSSYGANGMQVTKQALSLSS